ncbi:glycoside hydrolase family 28 protein [Niabella insulamsoli]|uniref:glycoside hydrolase family 28 protein n=1 Tax=Niabella insulamsoli TaxID=3144874 RepID=UPI0031FC3B6D
MIRLCTFLSILLLHLSVAAKNFDSRRVYFLSSDSIPLKTQVGAAAMPEHIAPIQAPFPMPQLQKPVFPTYSEHITAFGARENEKATQAIQRTIDAVASKGGGTVIIPKGKWLTGRIELKSNICLNINAGAEVYFSGEVADFRPAVFTRNEGIEVMSLGACIYANGQRNIAITGEGRLIGPAKGGSVRRQIMTKDVIENVVKHTTPVAERIYEGHNGDFIFPPMFISPINCNNVLIEGVTLENTAFWNVVPVYCDSVIIRGITVHSVGIPRGDGIDIESSRNVLIEYCTLRTGDDAFTMKAGRGYDGLRVNRPTENVVVRNGLVLEGHGGITVGSETASMIKNLYVHDCVFEEARSAIRFKTRRPRGGGGQYLYYENIRIKGSKYAFEWDMLGSSQHVGGLASRYPLRAKNELTPTFIDIFAKNIQIDSAYQFVKADGIPESPLQHVVLQNVTGAAVQLLKATDVDGFIVKNSKITVDTARMKLLDVRNMCFNKVQFLNADQKLEVTVEGPLSQNIRFKKTTPRKPQNWKRKIWRQKNNAVK